MTKLKLKVFGDPTEYSFENKINFPIAIVNSLGSRLKIDTEINPALIATMQYFKNYLEIDTLKCNAISKITTQKQKTELIKYLGEINTYIHRYLNMPVYEDTTLSNGDSTLDHYKDFKEKSSKDYHNLLNKSLRRKALESTYTLNDIENTLYNNPTQYFRDLLHIIAKDFSKNYTVPLEKCKRFYFIDKYTGTIDFSNDLKLFSLESNSLFRCYKDAQKAIRLLHKEYVLLFGITKHIYTQQPVPKPITESVIKKIIKKYNASIIEEPYVYSKGELPESKEDMVDIKVFEKYFDSVKDMQYAIQQLDDVHSREVDAKYLSHIKDVPKVFILKAIEYTEKTIIVIEELNNTKFLCTQYDLYRTLEDAKEARNLIISYLQSKQTTEKKELKESSDALTKLCTKSTYKSLENEENTLSLNKYKHSFRSEVELHMFIGKQLKKLTILLNNKIKNDTLKEGDKVYVIDINNDSEEEFLCIRECIFKEKNFYREYVVRTKQDAIRLLIRFTEIIEHV